MTTEAIEQFRERVNRDPGLQPRFVEAYAAGPAALVTLGQAQGFAFTEAEVTQAIEHGASGSELSEFELELISGGSDPRCQESSGAGRSEGGGKAG